MFVDLQVEIKPLDDADEFDGVLREICSDGRNAMLLDEILNMVGSNHKFLKQQQDMVKSQIESYKVLLQKIEVYRFIKELVGEKVPGANLDDLMAGEQGTPRAHDQINERSNLLEVGPHIIYLGGVLENEQLATLRRMIVRVCKGKVVVYSKDFVVPDEDKLLSEAKYGTGERSVFVLAFEEGQFLTERVKRLASSFKDKDVPTAETYEINIQTLFTDLNMHIAGREDSQKLIKNSRNVHRDLLQQFNKHDRAPGVSAMDVYRLYIRREKLIHEQMNKFMRLSQSAALSQGLVWVPRESDFAAAVGQNVTLSASGLSYERIEESALLKLTLSRPTKFYDVEFMSVFQQVVDTYGIPAYKEANPAVFTVISFPFLFGVMFGDVFHGAILLCFSIWLLLASKKDPTSLAASLAPVRYIFTLMGCYSLFCGLIYNDFTSFATEIFGKSCWVEDGAPSAGTGLQQMKRKDPECVYPVGIDPVWYRSDQEVQYMNSLKMKTAVIFGVAQMLLGTCLKISNSIYFGNTVQLVFVGLAQLVMMLATFGFMDYLIFVKWLTDWDPIMAEGKDVPGIINVMVAMFLTGGKMEGNVADVISNQQGTMSTALFLVAVCLPSMLLVEPFYEFYAHKKADVVPEDEGVEMTQLDVERGVQSSQHLEPRATVTGAPFKTDTTILLEQFEPKGAHGEALGDLFIHSMIETIEYALGTVSNTASYLRLWALSLAHSQLAAVFMNLTLGGFLQDGGYVTVSSVFLTVF